MSEISQNTTASAVVSISTTPALLSFKAAEELYAHGPKASTMSVWLCTGRYPEFTACVVYIGGRPRLKKNAYENLLTVGFGGKKRLPKAA